MWFSVGMLELGMVGVLLLTVAMLAAIRLPAWRWAMIVVACTIVATILSPADPLSTILLGVVLLIFFVSGIWATVTLRRIGTLEPTGTQQPKFGEDLHK